MNTDNQWMESVMRCTQCLDMCLSVCPVYFVKKNQSVSPSHLAHIAGLVKKGLVQTSPEVIEMLYQCMGCRLCKEWCIYDDLDLHELLISARTDMVKETDPENLPGFVIQAVANFQDHGTPFVSIPGLENELVKLKKSGGKDVLYFAGCTTRSFQPEIAVSFLKIMDALAVDYSFFPEREPCCGDPLLDLGYSEIGNKAADGMLEFIKASGCETVISSCSRCVKSLKETINQHASD